jgi:tripartite-type tricarboxylate transporter receptor subunit TctC
MPAVKRLLLGLVIGFGSSIAATGVPLAQSWPQRTVRLIVPNPPGTAVDISARLFAEQLATRWAQPVIVENITGADGTLAAKEFLRRTDNDSLVYSFAGLITINPVLREKLPYDPARDLVPIAMSSDNFLAIAVSSKLEVTSLRELVALGRSQPTKLNWAATPGLPYFGFAGFQKNAGLDMVYVSYRDFTPGLVDLGEGRIEVAATSLSQLLSHSQTGKVRVLAVMNRTRAPAAPEIPTAAEAGYPDLTFDGVTGFFGWRDMPAALRDRIAADVRAVADSASVKERLAAIGIVARGSTPAEFVAAIEEQRAKIASIAAAIGTKPTQ